MKPFLLTFLIICTILLAGAYTAGVEAAARARVAQEGIEKPTSLLTDIAFFEAWFFDRSQDGAKIGFSVSGAGDVNGDGFGDIIIGSPLFTPEGGIDEEGAAFVFYGAASGLNSTPDWMAGSGKKAAWFGCSVNSAGDVNGDGYDDVVVGAHYYKIKFEGKDGEPKSGAAFLYLGSETGLSDTADWVFFAEAPEILLGFSVASAGDVNNDGYADILIGAPHYEDTLEHVNEGKAYLFLGSATGPGNQPDWTYQCDSPNSSCGYAVGAAGDVDNDNYDDFLIGAPHYDNPDANEGAAFLFLGAPDGPAETADWTMEGNQEEAWFGNAVASAGDANGDGFSDVIVGSSHFNQDPDHLDVGAAFLYLGSTNGPGSSYNWMAYGSEEYAWFGHSVSTAGDTNRDGFSDILIGAYLLGQNGEENQPDEGAAYLFIGGASGPRDEYSWSAYGDKAEAEFGYAVDGAGDVNGDGKTDIIIGAPKYKYDEKTVMGRAFVYLNDQTTEYANNKVFIPFTFNSK